MINGFWLTEQGGQRLSSLEELGGRDSVVVGGINRDVREGLLDSVEPGRHDVYMG